MHEGRLDQGTAVSSFVVCVRCWYKCGVNLASDLLLLFFCEAAHAEFPPPPHPPQYLLGICVTGALGPYFHRCQSLTLLKLFGQVMHILLIKIALIFPICRFTLFRPCKFGIVLKLSIVRVVQGWPVWSPAGQMLYPFQNPSHHLTFQAAY